MYSQSLFEFGHQVYERHAEPITLSSVTTSLSCFSIEQMIEINQKDIFLLFAALVWKMPLARNRVKLSITAHRYLWSHTNKKKKKSAGWLVKHRGFQRYSSTLGRLPALLKGGFSSKQMPVTLPILLPIKIYWKHLGNTVQLISSQLACQKQTNTPITRTKKESFSGLLSS